jgi:hypothetical protein
MAMPKAPMHEDSKTAFPVGKVWASRQVAIGRNQTQPKVLRDSPHREFCGRVPLLYSTHASRIACGR